MSTDTQNLQGLCNVTPPADKCSDGNINTTLKNTTNILPTILSGVLRNAYYSSNPQAFKKFKDFLDEARKKKKINISITTRISSFFRGEQSVSAIYTEKERVAVSFSCCCWS